MTGLISTVNKKDITLDDRSEVKLKSWAKALPIYGTCLYYTHYCYKARAEVLYI